MQSLSVSQLNTHIRALLENDPILCDIWVSGEISNLSRPGSGHTYFTLKDEAAQIRCAYFKRYATALSLAAVDHGAQVLVHGNVSFYESRGELQLYVDAVQPAGIGVLAAEFERLRAQLEAEGLFAPERKRQLPRFPRRVGVVTSASGAVFHDICHVLARRWPLVEVLLTTTLVQGDGAGAGIVSAIERLNNRDGIDVIILARGGGSIEDLWAFNLEAVARAIFASRIPIVSGIGHEIDYTIADFVADKRAPTPSAAAELVVPDRIDVALRVGDLAGSLRSDLHASLDRRLQQIDRARRSLERRRPDPQRLLVTLADVLGRMRERLHHELVIRRHQIEGRNNQLVALSPAGTLARGYALVQRPDGHVIARAAETQAGDEIRVRMADGGFGARVEEAGGARPTNGAARPARARPIASEQSRLL